MVFGMLGTYFFHASTFDSGFHRDRKQSVSAGQYKGRQHGPRRVDKRLCLSFGPLCMELTSQWRYIPAISSKTNRVSVKVLQKDGIFTCACGIGR